MRLVPVQGRYMFRKAEFTDSVQVLENKISAGAPKDLPSKFSHQEISRCLAQDSRAGVLYSY